MSQMDYFTILSKEHRFYKSLKEVVLVLNPEDLIRTFHSLKKVKFTLTLKSRQFSLEACQLIRSELVAPKKLKNPTTNISSSRIVF